MKLKFATIAPLVLASLTANAQISDAAIRIGVISDMNGPYSSQGGRGTLRAVELAVKDFGGKVLGSPIEVLSVDYQNKVDTAATKAREWFDVNKVDLIVESTDSAAAIAMQAIAAEKQRPIIFASAGTTVLTNKECSPFGIQYTYNSYALATAIARGLVQEGRDSWFFLTLDRAFGASVEGDASAAVTAGGGKVLGSVKHPLNASDFSSFLVQAQQSKAKVIALANAATDTQNAARQAAQFGINKSQTIAPLLMYDTDVRGLGLRAAQGMKFATSFYWDRTPETQAWSRRFFELHKSMPTMIHAGAYSATMHYLKSVEVSKTDNGEAVVKQMKAKPINDFFATNGQIRQDGLMVHDMHLAEVKKPADSKDQWDIAKIQKVVPKDEAFPPLSASTCPLVR